MITQVKQYTCDLCHKAENENQTKGVWAFGTEVGDLCPSCARAWDNFKQSFIEKMKIENKERLV